MERFLLVQLIVIGVILVLAALPLAHSSGSTSRKWAKIRVEIDEAQRQLRHAPEEKEGESQGLYLWMILAVILFFFVLMLTN
jgi:hypothetical protein